MRLLHAKTYKFKVFETNSRPAYAILSHRWSNQEVTFSKLMQCSDPTTEKGLGFRKITECCKLALATGLDWVWVDTCCIDKTSSQEVSEAINSMFQWYNYAAICFVFLPDLVGELPPIPSPEVSISDDGNRTPPPPPDDQPDPSWATFDETGFRQSIWFSRGWTLQELLAPAECKFYDRNYNCIGRRSTLIGHIHNATNIPEDLLRYPAQLHQYPAAAKISWMSSRKTTKAEDMAYSLIGILNINMPLLYGEGGIKAFVRLQREIVETTGDDSIYTWDRSIRLNPTLPSHIRRTQSSPLSLAPDSWHGLLAPSPAAFHTCTQISLPLPLQPHAGVARSMTNLGLELRLGMPKTTPLSETHVPSLRTAVIILTCLDTSPNPSSSSQTKTRKRKNIEEEVALGLRLNEDRRGQHSHSAFAVRGDERSTSLLRGVREFVEGEGKEEVQSPFGRGELKGVDFVYSSATGVVYIPKRDEKGEKEKYGEERLQVYQGATFTGRFRVYQSGR